MDDLIDQIEKQVKLENRMVEEEVRSINFSIQELELAKTGSNEEVELMETRIDELHLTKKRVEEEWRTTMTRHFERVKRIFEGGNCTSAQRSLELQFRNKIPESILTGEEIRGDGDINIEVALVDAIGNIVDVGAEASANVEIVVLKGEADSCEGDNLRVEAFKDQIIQEEEGKKPFLAGNVCLKLRRGIAVLDNIMFRHHTCKMKPPALRLGAQVVGQIFDGVCVKEAKTEPFVVKDFRNKYYKKHKTPSLFDDVSRLVNIRKGGKIRKRLHDNNIDTVEHFLIQLLIDPEGLKTIVNLMGKKWEATVNNARACLKDKRMYCYNNDQQNMGAVFNILGEVLGLYVESQYIPSNMMSESHKAHAKELLESACSNWKNTVFHFDDEKPLQLVLSLLNDPETGLEDFSFLSAHSVGNICDALLSQSPGSCLNPQTNFPCMDCDMGPINESKADDQIAAATGAAFVESREVFHINTMSSKRWTKLFCVLKWFSIRKKVSVEGNHRRKKQKICSQDAVEG